MTDTDFDRERLIMKALAIAINVYDMLPFDPNREAMLKLLHEMMPYGATTMLIEPAEEMLNKAMHRRIEAGKALAAIRAQKDVAA